MNFPTRTAGPVPMYSADALMDADAETRANMMSNMGVRNAMPPLPHSPCVRNRRTGVVLPWNELLSEQQDLFDCCDEEGNTDPAAWEDKVIRNAPSQQELSMMARERLFVIRDAQSQGQQGFARPVEPAVQRNTSGVSELEKLGVTPYANIANLQGM